MDRALLISIRFGEGRYHGLPEWPPGPARLFQAAVAAAANGRELAAKFRAALGWLETLDPPAIAAPVVRDGNGFKNYVPNNDLDAVGGDPSRIAAIRTPKWIKPRLFDAEAPLLYVWAFAAGEENERNAQLMCSIAERLYQLGRGVDMAWASAEVLNAGEAGRRLGEHGGAVYRPGGASEGIALACPQPGSLRSLEERYAAQARRFAVATNVRTAQVLFAQAPKPRFKQIVYDSPVQRFIFELRDGTPEDAFAPWPLARTVQLVELIREGAAKKLAGARPAAAATIERLVTGRGAGDADKAQRVRIVPLPSIGHTHADHAIRRVMIEIPPNFPLPFGDVRWAFSGLDIVDARTGEVLGTMVDASAEMMTSHYGADQGEPHSRWRTVTPAALPVRQAAARAGGRERATRESAAARSVAQALRHAGVPVAARAIKVQREPFTGSGMRAEAFAAGTRFAAPSLAHVEIEFERPQSGPLIIGDGRYLGLGLMAPVKDALADALILDLRGQYRPPLARSADVLRAVRRALMSRDASLSGGPTTLFTGHDRNDPGPARSGQHRHVYLLTDTDDEIHVSRVAIVAPWRVDRSWQPQRDERARFVLVAGELEIVRAGAAGVLAFAPARTPSASDPAFSTSRTWLSRTAYRPSRHPKSSDAAATRAAIAADLIGECVRRGLPAPSATVIHIELGPRGAVSAQARLDFSAAVAGPILLGRDAHLGGGWFVGKPETYPPGS